VFAQEYKFTETIPLGGNGAWDYLRTDTESRRLYVSHSGEVVVLDLNTQQVLGKLTGFGFIHVIVIVKDLRTGFLSDGQKNEVISFDPATLTLKNQNLGEPEQHGVRPVLRAIVCKPQAQQIHHCHSS
jgi:hypothetical protein